MVVRTGDVVGLGGNYITNFLYLVFKRGIKYAWKQKSTIVPRKLYVVCKARGNDLLYLATTTKTDIKFRKLKKGVWRGKPEGFDSLMSTMKLNDYIRNKHQELTIGVADGYGKNHNHKFISDCFAIGENRLDAKFSQDKSNLSNLDILETGNYGIIEPK